MPEQCFLLIISTVVYRRCMIATEGESKAGPYEIRILECKCMCVYACVYVCM